MSRVDARRDSVGDGSSMLPMAINPSCSLRNVALRSRCTRRAASCHPRCCAWFNCRSRDPNWCQIVVGNSTLTRLHCSILDCSRIAIASRISSLSWRVMFLVLIGCSAPARPLSVGAQRPADDMVLATCALDLGGRDGDAITFPQHLIRGAGLAVDAD